MKSNTKAILMLVLFIGFTNWIKAQTTIIEKASASVTSTSLDANTGNTGINIEEVNSPLASDKAGNSGDQIVPAVESMDVSLQQYKLESGRPWVGSNVKSVLSTTGNSMPINDLSVGHNNVAPAKTITNDLLSK